MRQIKFRAWHKNLKKMVDVYQMVFDFATNRSRKELEEPDLITSVGKLHGIGGSYELMQYTGLKDKNGKEIYEGDILEWKSEEEGSSDKYEVTWNEEKCGFRAEWLRDRKQMHSPENDFEIIGNIYENPELLKI